MTRTIISLAICVPHVGVFPILCCVNLSMAVGPAKAPADVVLIDFRSPPKKAKRPVS